MGKKMKAGLKEIFRLQFWLIVFQTFLKMCQRFFLSVLSLVCFTALALVENHNIDLLTDNQWQRGMLISFAGALWFLAFRLFSESHGWSKVKEYSLALPLFSLIFWQISTNDSSAIASLTLILSVALAIPFAAYLFRQNNNSSIWYFNFQLVTAICFAVLSALILSGGLSLILKSIGYLFEIEINYKFYSDTWLIGWCFFAPAYFLANVPAQFDYQRSDCDFPRGVHFIQNYVLVPLSLVFMVILYAYFAKILLQWELPRGNLGVMISTFGVIGIFTHLTIYPVHTRGAFLLNWFYRHFYKMMIVPLGLLVLAITVRISQYGLTEPRYIVVISVAWFALLIAYNLTKGAGFQIKNVFLAIAVLFLVASFGSWRIDKLPVQDQFNRLQALLVEEALLVDEQFVWPKVQPDFETRKSISSMTNYVVSHGEAERMRHWFKDQKAYEKAAICKEDNYRCRNNTSFDLVKYMGIDYVDRWEMSGKGGAFYINLRDKNDINPFGKYSRRISVKDFDYMVQVTGYRSNCKGKCKERYPNPTVSPGFGMVKAIIKEGNMLEISSDDFQPLIFDLNPMVEQFQASGAIDVLPEEADKLVLDKTTEEVKARLLLNHLHGFLKEGEKQASNLGGVLLLKFKTTQ